MLSKTQSYFISAYMWVVLGQIMETGHHTLLIATNQEFLFKSKRFQ